MDVFECLKKHGQCLDLQIAEETGIPLVSVRTRLDDLASKGDIIKCRVTRFDQGIAVHSWLCRIAGYTPPKAAARKPTAAG